MQDNTASQTTPSPEKSSAPPDPSQPLKETAMLADELQQIANLRRGGNAEGPWIGLALSGGGIRSATFCLGALQRLARADILRHFDFMSTVSGGGYTGASLQWWWVRDSNSDTGENFPYGTKVAASTADEDKKLAFLRWHANFLAPGGGMSIWSVLAVVLRTLIISLFVWIPIAVAVMMLIEGLPFYIYGLLTRPDLFPGAGWNELRAFSNISLWPFSDTIFKPIFVVAATDLIGLLCLTFVVASMLLLITSILVPPETSDNKSVRIRHAKKFAALAIVAGALGAAYILGIQNHRSGTFTIVWRQLSPIDAILYLTSAALLVLGFIALCVMALQRFNIFAFGVNYTFRRNFETYATYGFAVLIALAILASLPFAATGFESYQTEKGAVLGIVTALSGLLSGFYGHFVQAQKLAPAYATRWFATIAAGVFLYGMILISYLVAHFLMGPSGTVFGLTTQHLRSIFFAVLFFASFFGYYSNLNYLGLHRFYRDRLMEAFLPSKISTSTAPPEYSEAELLALSDLWDVEKFPVKNRPYPLFNTNVILVNDKDAKRALRGGDSFVLSPLFVGSSATDWMRTTEHGKKHGPLTLATAMAASGAAANANAAYIGSGITRDRLISIVMMLLNIRLGVWLGRPGTTFKIPNYFMPGLAYGVLRAGYRSESAFVELTDGGHFDNLGVYELVRRRVDIILVLDSEEDPSTSMSALASVCQRVLEDFNVVIDIKDKADKLTPSDSMGYPSDAKYTARSFFIADVAYPSRPAANRAPVTGKPNPHLDKKTGKLVYVKSNMLKGLSFPAKGYKAKNPDFPNQSTMDQFFDPAQFEAYRELGFFSIDAFVAALRLDGKDRASFVNAIKKKPT